MRGLNFQDGSLCYVMFSKTWGCEINGDHLGVMFNVRGVENMVFCIPLTSAKPKHFNNKKAYMERNYLETKKYTWHYIRQTDSIAQMEQIRMLAIERVRDWYRNDKGLIIRLNTKELDLIKKEVTDYINKMFNK